MLRLLPLLIFFTACQSDAPELQQIWVRQYVEYSDHSSSLALDRTHLLRFTKDSMLGNSLPMDFYEGEQFLWYDSYTIVEDSLFAVGEKYAHAYGINLQGDSLTLAIENQTTVYRPLPRYHQARHYDELYELLSGATYYLRDSIRLELTENHLLFVDRPAYEHWDRRIWSLYNYDGELFFIISDAFGVNWHVKSFNKDSVTAVGYGKQNYEVTLIRRPTPTPLPRRGGRGRADASYVLKFSKTSKNSGPKWSCAARFV